MGGIIVRASKRIEQAALWIVASLAASALPARAAWAQLPDDDEIEAPRANVARAPMRVAQRPPPLLPPSDEVSPYVDRGILLDAGQARTTFELGASTTPIHCSTLDASLGMSLGLTDRLTVDGSLGTISLMPDARYRDPQLGMTLGLVKSDPLELDLSTRVSFGFGNAPTVAAVEPGAVAVMRMGHVLRFDAGAYMPIGRGENAKISMRVPVSLAVQLGPFFHASVSSGVNMPDLRDPQGTAKIPLGFAVGATAPLGSGGFAFVSPSITWPSVAEIGAPERGGTRPMIVGATIGITTPP
ncbi:Hypothetical protein A7982_05393 [Minicystis rosea]|nr:Hypothetical protein A7982_05393 [Minicystis rosea]